MPGLLVTCDEKADCASGDSYCCVNLADLGNPGGPGPTVRCTSSAACAGFVSGVVCKADIDCPPDRPRCCAEVVGSLLTPVTSRICRATACP